MKGVLAAISVKIDSISAQEVVFFTRGDNLANLNNAMLYVARNEHTNRMKFVIVVADPADVPARLKQDLKFLDEAYPGIDIELVVWTGTFGPALISELSEKWKIPTNFMFIGSPAGHLMYGGGAGRCPRDHLIWMVPDEAQSDSIRPTVVYEFMGRMRQ